ncbi:MAG TPA: sigma-70 family RNA polymerase sigma factor, partial [Anaeromyxobacteraceae bacterium]|nr:sigma-70 family RNA polymerase sigma factor [Anaeromyxobacteraceae bacterium]
LPGGEAAESRARQASDEALVGAFLVGDDEAFGELVRRHEALVLSIARRYTRSPEDARDLAQRAFLRALEAVRRGIARGRREGFPFRRWLLRIAANLAKNHLRDRSRWARAPLETVSAAGPDAAADEALARAESARNVRRAVLRLPRRQREVLTLRIDAELPFREIAETLGITENAAKVSFHHAARRLRDEVEREDRP